MKTATYVTGNANKAKYFSKMVGIDIPHESVSVEEIQSLDPRLVVAHKARAAYSVLKKPVIVEDTYLKFEEMGELPGTLIKWFIEQLGFDKVCRLLDHCSSRAATAGAVIAHYDGAELAIFDSCLNGTISEHPTGDEGFGWNAIFVPEGETRTLGELSDEEFRVIYAKIKPFNELRDFLIS